MALLMIWETSSSNRFVFFVFFFFLMYLQYLDELLFLNQNMIIFCSLFLCLSVLLNVVALRTIVVLGV
jgi:hypothetical protein